MLSPKSRCSLRPFTSSSIISAFKPAHTTRSHHLFRATRPSIPKPLPAPHPRFRCLSSPSSPQTAFSSTCSHKAANSISSHKNATPHTHSPASAPPSVLSSSFWLHSPTWRLASLNTLRCLVGCTSGDFAAMWTFQSYYPQLGVGITMPIAMASGLLTSLLLETTLLTRPPTSYPFPLAMRTAFGMSFLSMLAMEIAENSVDYYLTGGVVAFGDVRFWVAAGLAMGAGWVVPMPWAYWRLRAWGKACH